MLALAATPLALSLLTLWPVRILVYGEDLFRTGGDDYGRGDAIFGALYLGFFAWSGLLLLLIGVRAVHGWTWGRAVGAVALAAAFPALIVSRRRSSSSSSALERGALLVRHRVRVLLLRERAAAHLVGVAAERLDDRVADVGVALHEPRRVSLVVAEHVVPDEHLAVRVAAGADADRRHGERLRHRARDRRRHRLEHDREAAGVLKRERVVDRAAARGRRCGPAP